MKTILSLSGLAFLFLVLGATVFVVQKRQGIGEIAQVYPPSVAPVSQSPSSPPASPPATPPATPPPSLPPSPPATPTPSGLSVPTPIPTLGYILLTPPPVVGVPIIQATTPLGAVTQNNLSDWCLNNPDQCVADPAGFYRTMALAAAPSVILTGVLTAPLWGPAAIDAAIAAGPTITQVGFWTAFLGTGAGFAGIVGQTSTQIVYPVFSGKTINDRDTSQIIKSIDYFSSIALYAGSGAAVVGQGIYSSGLELNSIREAKISSTRSLIEPLGSAELNKMGRPVLEVAGPTSEGIFPLNTEQLKVPYIVSNKAVLPGQPSGENVVYAGRVDLGADYTRLAVGNNSVGCITGSCMMKNSYGEFAQEAERVVAPGGYVVLQGAFGKDITKAFEETSLRLLRSGYSPERVSAVEWEWGPDAFIYQK